MQKPNLHKIIRKIMKFYFLYYLNKNIIMLEIDINQLNNKNFHLHKFTYGFDALHKSSSLMKS